MTRLLCTAAVAALALTALAGGAAADTCAEARAENRYVGHEITDPRVTQALADIVKASGLEPNVVACELKMPYFNAIAENLGGHYYIGISPRVLAQSTDAELRAVIGHEMGHIALGQRVAGFELTHHRTIKYEEQADALSARWFGKEGMISVLTKLKADAQHLPSETRRRLATAEIDARIKALQ